MNHIRVVRGTDQKVHFAVFDNAQQRTPVDLSVYTDVVFEVFGANDDRPLLKKSIGTNGIAFRLDGGNGRRGDNEITVFIAADDTARFGANRFSDRCDRVYRLTGLKGDGERNVIHEGFFYSEPSGGEASVLRAN